MKGFQILLSRVEANKEGVSYILNLWYSSLSESTLSLLFSSTTCLTSMTGIVIKLKTYLTEWNTSSAFVFWDHPMLCLTTARPLKKLHFTSHKLPITKWIQKRQNCNASIAEKYWKRTYIENDSFNTESKYMSQGVWTFSMMQTTLPQLFPAIVWLCPPFHTQIFRVQNTSALCNVCRNDI